MKARSPFQDILVTLFSRRGCSLCDKVKPIVKQEHKVMRFQSDEVDIMEPKHKPWRDFYEYDVPVLHIQKYVLSGNKPNQKVLSEATKLWHTWTAEELQQAINDLQDKDEGGGEDK